MIRTLTLFLLVLLAGVHTACNRAAAATLSGTVMMTYSNKPYVGAVLIRPLSTPLTINGNLVTGGDFKAITDANGNLTVALQAGNYRVTIGADKGFTIDVPNDSNTYTWIERIITALTWNSSIIPSTNSSTATIISYTNVAEMVSASVPTSPGNIVSVLGRLTANDGGGGFFWFDSTSSTATNLGTVFAPATGSGRWFRSWNGGPINILWFGAQPTKDVGGTLTPGASFDNATRINAAINFARTPSYGPNDVRASVFVPAGDFWISTPITNRYRVDVIGLGCVFSDNEFTSHATNSSGLVSGPSRIRLADGANCPMMVWDLSDASKRYTWSWPDTSLSLAATITIASPAVITVTNHGLTVGRKVGFTTTGTLPTGLTASTIYYVASVPSTNTLTVSTTVGGAAINTSGTQSGTHLMTKDPSERWVAGTTIRGINFSGNSANQTRYDCHILDLRYAWNVRIDNCALNNPSGYMIFGIENNTLDIVDCYGAGSTSKTKGVFLWSCADGFMSQSKFGGASGPALWIAGPGGWQQQYTGNFLFNCFDGKFQVSGISGDEITFTGTHDFETGMPVEFFAPSGSTLPPLTLYGLLPTDKWVFWVIKTAADKIKIAYSYEDAVAGTALGITAGTGTYYAWHGPGAGAYLSAQANNNVLTANRCDQNLNAGIYLNYATENTIANNLANLNGFNTLTGLPDPGPSAGIYLRNGSKNNVVLGNSMMDLGSTYAQTYGLWVDANNGRNFVGQNAYKANPSQVDTLISQTSNTTETSVVQLPTGTTLYADSTGSPLTLARYDNLNQWKMELSGLTNVMRIKNAYAGNTALNISSPTTDVSINFGSPASTATPRPAFLTGELASSSAGTDVAAGDFYLTPSVGTGASLTGGRLFFYTADATASGSTVQTSTRKLTLKRQGQMNWNPRASEPTFDVSEGDLFYKTGVGFRYYNGSAWSTLGGGGASGAISPDSVTLLGTAGAGYVSFPAQSSAPSAPASGFVEYADSSGRVAWRRASDGFIRTFSSTLTANRTFTYPDADTTIPIASQQLTITGPTAARTITVPDASFTVARTDAAQSFTGLQTFVGNAETRNGTSGTQLEIFKTYSGAGANYESLRIDGGIKTASEFSIGTYSAGTGLARALSIYGGGGLWLQSDSGNVTLNASGTIALRTGAATRWNIGPNLTPQTANAVDLGGSGTEVRSLYLGTSAILSSAATIGWNADTFLVRNAANTVAARNSTTAQRLQVFNTYTDASNGEWFDIDWITSANKVRIGSNKNGTGSTRIVEFISGGTAAAQIDSSGNLYPATSNGQSSGISGNRWNSVFVQTKINLGASGADVLLTGEAANILQLGQDAASATTQTIKALDGTGTDIAGSTLVRAGGKSTGTGRGGDLSDQTSLSATSTGSSANSYSTRSYMSAKPVDLTESVDTQFVTITVGTGKQLGAHLVCTVCANDGTDFQSLTSLVTVDAINKAGTITRQKTQVDNTAAVSAGTLTATYVVTDNGSGVIGIKCNAVSSLTQTVLRVKWSIDALNSDDVATVTPN